MKKLWLLFFNILSVIFSPLIAQQLVINEFMSSNATTLQDSDGDYSDWIELFNNNDNALNLEGYMISDDTLVPDKWIFPSITIMPGKHLLIFASDKNRYDTTELHTNFKIKSEGEYLLLSSPDTIALDQINPVALATDRSFGRYPDGSESWVNLSMPTPGSANLPAASMLHFSVPAGCYTAPLKLGLSSSHADDVIYFSTDGSFPTQNANIYSDSIPLDLINQLPNRIANIPTTPDPASGTLSGALRCPEPPRFHFENPPIPGIAAARTNRA